MTSKLSSVHRSLLAVCVLLIAAPAGGDPAELEVYPAELAATATELRDKALTDSDAYGFVAELTTKIGPRPAGSVNDRRAVAWAVERLESYGLEVTTEPVQVPHWVRGTADGRITAPYPQPVHLVALGGSVGTPEGGIEAEVIEVEGIEALEALEPGAVEGKIVFFNRRMQRLPHGAGYRTAVQARVGGPTAAAPLGAVAVVVRSVGTSNHRFGHTGGTRYADGVRKIPAAALSNPDADLLAAQIASGEPVRFHLDMTCRNLPDEMSANVLGEIKGREKPEEIVVLAAHLDSWDLGTGAVDDGAGCAIVSEAARMIAAMAQAPRRTIRVFLAANEEFGLSGARVYGELHADELALHTAAIEADFGVGKVSVLRSRVEPDRMPWVRDLERLLAPLGISHIDMPAFGGADLRPLVPARVPFFDLPQDDTLYFDYHHNADDTLDKLSPEDLKQNVAAYVTLAYLLAETDYDLGRAPAREGS
ncbi:MAG: M28 family peptidase [Acidobacteriota bacterium]